MSIEKSRSSNQFVVALSQHRMLGNIFIPLYISTLAENIYSIAENLHGKKPEDFNLQPAEQSILKLCNEYSEKVLAKKFGKSANTKQFIEKMDVALFDQHIRPYIDSKMMAIASLLAESQSIKLYYKDRKYNNVYEDNCIVVEPSAATPIFNFNLSTDGLMYHIDAEVNGSTVNLTTPNAEVAANSPALILIKKHLYRFEEIDSKKLAPFFAKPSIVIPTNTVRKYMETFVLNAVKSQKVRVSGFDIVEPNVKAVPVITLAKGLDSKAILTLTFSYDNRDFYSGSQTEPLVTLRSDQKRFVFTKYQRDIDTEVSIANAIRQFGLEHHTGATYCIPSATDLDADTSLNKTVEWLNEHAAQLNNLGIRVGQQLDGQQIYLGECTSLLQATSTPTGFDIKGGIMFGTEFLSLAKIRKAVIKGQPMVELNSGRLAIIPQLWFKERRQLLVFGREQSEMLHLQKQHFLLVDGIGGIDPKEIEELKKFSESNLNTGSNQVDGVNATLRDYQRIGLAWLKYLQMNNFGGCLADDMGLGKTLQTIAMLQYCKANFTYDREVAIKPKAQADLFSQLETHEGKKVSSSPISLIVVPTSLVHNWRNEFRKFAPSIKIYEHIGGSRAKSASAFPSFDVIITTYGIVRNDYSMLCDFEFFYLIADESQTIKNPTSATYKAMMQLRSQNRLSLSGTPIENGLTDLWAQMNFLNKGLLSSLSLFKEQFVIPIEKYNHEGRQEKLKSLIEPFILRRTKEKVASELPAVTELEVFCEMTDAQRNLYEEEKRLAKEQMIAEIEGGTAKKNQFIFLQLLTKLREIANHPSLAGYEGINESGKFEEITRNIENVIGEGHKVLIFSSFVQHLNLVSDYLEDREIKYKMLTGSSTNRQEIINDFKNDSACKVFLISLKAGGIGLNLTEADYVFLIDPWWNPAAENQAISRAHRIGQKHKVFAYRFITTNSIEERIMELQRQKQELADLFVNSNNPLSKISEEMLLQLL